MSFIFCSSSQSLPCSIWRVPWCWERCLMMPGCNVHLPRSEALNMMTSALFELMCDLINSHRLAHLLIIVCPILQCTKAKVHGIAYIKETVWSYMLKKLHSLTKNKLTSMVHQRLKILLQVKYSLQSWHIVNLKKEMEHSRTGWSSCTYFLL